MNFRALLLKVLGIKDAPAPAPLPPSTLLTPATPFVIEEPPAPPPAPPSVPVPAYVMAPLTPQVSVPELMEYMGANASDLAHEYGHVVEFFANHPELRSSAAIVDAYRKAASLRPAVASDEDAMWNAGVGFPVENLDLDGARFIMKMGWRQGGPLWFRVLAGRRSQINAWIDRVSLDFPGVNSFDADAYQGGVRAYVEALKK